MTNVATPTNIAIRVYTALITQTGTAAPTITVLQNTLGGTVVWTRDTTGTFLGTLNEAFPANKTILEGVTTAENRVIQGNRDTDNRVIIYNRSASGAVSDGIAEGAWIEIRVYNNN